MAHGKQTPRVWSDAIRGSEILANWTKLGISPVFLWLSRILSKLAMTYASINSSEEQQQHHADLADCVQVIDVTGEQGQGVSNS
jgi:hypothetical protein